MKAVLAVDPGLTSGFCFIVWSGNIEDDPKILSTVELKENEYATHIRKYMESWEDYTDFFVVCERFVINAQTVRNSQAPYSLEQIGALKQICRDSGYPVEKIVFQSPVDAKNMFPNKALKILEKWHVGGAGHALDAIRHALLTLVRTYRWVPRLLLDNLESN
jgi:mRNA-degrading endonuclease HigB of HigAB toxin-antitoxin module